MTTIRVQSKVIAVEIDFGSGHSSFIFERSSEGGVMVSRVTEGGQSLLGVMDPEQFDEFKSNIEKL